MNSLAHTEINVKDLKISTAFWNDFLKEIDWNQFEVGDEAVSGFEAPDGTHIFLAQTEDKFLNKEYSRKNIGLNHVAFRVESKEKVDSFANFLKEKNLATLYTEGPKDYSSDYSREDYYAVFFEDPDRIKIEVVFCK